MNVAGIKLKLPNGWKWVRCEEVIDVRDGTHDTPKYVSSGYPLITSKNLKPEGIDFSTISYISEKDHFEISKRSKVDRGDILFAMIGTIGNPVIVDVDREFSIKNVALFKFSKSPIDVKYFKYLLETPIITRQLDFEERGGTQKFVSLKVLRNMTIPFPPLEEQQRIAAILDKADAVRKKRSLAIQLTEELLRATFLDMFGDLILFMAGNNQPCPKGWTICKLGDQLTLQRGFDLTKNQCQEGIYPVISSGGISAYHSEFKALGPGVLLGRKGSVGRVHYIKENYWPHDTTLWVKDFKGNHPLFIYHFFKWFPISHFEASTSNPTLNRNRLHPVNVLWPPHNLQSRFAAISESVSKSNKFNESALSESNNLFNTLLHRAFNGEL